MRSKAPLALMEQAVMVLVFALAAALCLRVFVSADQLSRTNQARDTAVLQAQCAAEAVKHAGGDAESALSGAAAVLGGQYDRGLLQVDYAADWTPSSGPDCAYRLTARGVDSGTAGLGKALIQVSTAREDPQVLFHLEIAWQEVDEHGG